MMWLTLALLALAVLVAAALAPVLSPVEGASANQGLQGGWAVDDAGNVLFDKSVVDTLPFMEEAGAGWVRINFRLGECYANWTDPGRYDYCAYPSALDAYDAVIAEAGKRNLKVLGLLSNESWHGDQEQWTANNAEVDGGSGDNAYIQAFASAAGLIAGYFGGRVPHWEVWNEPNAWTSLDAKGNPTGGTFIYPSNFAWLLKRSYQEINSSAVVVSGGVFGHDIGGTTATIMQGGRLVQVTKRGEVVGAAGRPVEDAANGCSSTLSSGADYLCKTYEMGISKASWSKPYPLDHIGQHVYIDQGGATNAKKLNTYLKDVRNAYLYYEGSSTAKKTHITEFGWQTPSVSERTQANNLKTAYDTYKKAGYVGRAYWFFIQDIPAAELRFGLVRADDTKKPAFKTYQTAAAY